MKNKRQSTALNFSVSRNFQAWSPFCDPGVCIFLWLCLRTAFFFLRKQAWLTHWIPQAEVTVSFVSNPKLNIECELLSSCPYTLQHQLGPSHYFGVHIEAHICPLTSSLLIRVKILPAPGQYLSLVAWILLWKYWHSSGKQWTALFWLIIALLTCLDLIKEHPEWSRIKGNSSH